MNYIEISAIECLGKCNNFLRKNPIRFWTTKHKLAQIKRANELVEISNLRHRTTVRLYSGDLEFLKGII